MPRLYFMRHAKTEMKKGPIKNAQLVVVTDEHYKKWRERNE